MVNTQKVTRKLRAILSADVKGYSRLMSDDESYTIKILKEYRVTMSEIIQQHYGRVVDAPGDNLLAEFSSIVNAVQSAVEIQKTLKQKNADVPYNKKLEFRIGVNIGDVVQDGESLYGEGVNIAARIEGLADPGGICISRGAYDHIKNKLDFGYEYIGEHSVKNIKDPVRVYKILMSQKDAGKIIGDKPKPILQPGTWATLIVAAIVLILIGYQVVYKTVAPEFEPASTEKMEYPLPDKPSIAVLPFDNMSGDPSQEYFSDGLTEEIITALSKVPKIFVIARNSTFTYKRRPVKVQEIAEDLGVRYILEGSIKKIEDRVRVNAKLIDAVTGHHLWAERYDRHFSDIFVVQDKITNEILLALQINLTHGEQARIYSKGTDNFNAYLKVMQAQWYSYLGTKEGNAKARKLAEEAVELDPGYAYAYRILGVTHVVGVFLKTSKSPKESIQQAITYNKRAIALDESFASAYATLGYIMAMVRKHDESIRLGKKALKLEPDSADVLHICGAIFTYAGMQDEAIPLFRRALRLNPKPPNPYYRHFGHALRASGQYEEAIAIQKKAIRQEPDDILAYVILASSAGLAGHHEEARLAVEEILRIDPKYSCERLIAPFKDSNQIKRVAEALRKAGLPDHPPSQLPDKPSIAVLPFNNKSGDSEQEYFSDGITEDIITALSKTPKMIVISRKSTFKYKGKPIKIQKIGQDLGAKFILEGSIRKDGERIRITAQLIDAQTGHYMWAEKYDREQKNVFALQDEITQKIITALQVKLTEGEQAIVRSKGSSNLDAYLLVIKARELVRHFNHDDNLKAKEYLRKAIELDPNYAPAYRWLSSSHYMDTWIGSTKSTQKSLQKAGELSKKALSIDASLGDAHALLGCIYIKQKEYDKSLPELEKAVELYPSGSDTLAIVANQYLYLDRTDEAILLMKKAIEPFPIPPGWALNALAAMYRSKGDYEEALKWSQKAVNEQPRNFISHLNMCSIYSLMGREEDARLQAREVLKLKPKFSVKKFEEGLPYKNLEVKKTYMNAVRKAGLPE